MTTLKYATAIDRTILEAWAYGEVKECPNQQQWPHPPGPEPPCPVCHGTGEVRGPGLAERVRLAAHELHTGTDSPDRTAENVLAALRAELGEGP